MENKMIKALGYGEYGSVYLCKKGKEQVAVKHSLRRKSKDPTTSFINELENLLVLQQCDGFVQLISFELDDEAYGLEKHSYTFRKNRRNDNENYKPCFDYLQITTKLCDGNIAFWISTNPSFDEIKDFMIQMLSAGEFMSSRGLMHRDLKPENILYICNNGRTVFQIADLGFMVYESCRVRTDSQVTTLQYRAPEILLDKPHGIKSDVWSMACIFFQLWSSQKKSLFHQFPCNGIPATIKFLIGHFHFNKIDSGLIKIKHPSIIVQNILKEDFPGMLKWNDNFVRTINGISSQGDNAINLIDLFSGMFKTNDRERWTFTDCLNSPFFTKWREGKINSLRNDYDLSCDGKWLLSNSILSLKIPYTDDYNRNMVIKYFSTYYKFLERNVPPHHKPHQIWFHAFDFYERSHLQTRDDEDAYITAATFIYLVYKYILTFVIWKDIETFNILPKKIRSNDFISLILQKEKTVLLLLYDISLYSETFYELMDRNVVDDWEPLAYYLMYRKLPGEIEENLTFSYLEHCNYILENYYL